MQCENTWPPEVIIAPGVVFPPDFKQISYSAEPAGLGENFAGCLCNKESCDIGKCPCVRRNPLGQVFEPHSNRLLPLVHALDFNDTVFRCGPTCACQGLCGNAPTLQPPNFRITLAVAGGKGLGGFAAEPIPRGSFVALYAGEYLRAAEAEARLREYDRAGVGHALLIIREALQTAILKTYLDGTRQGNISRFFNHRCDGGNLAFVTVRGPGAVVPELAFFASCDIAENEELTYLYGPPNSNPEQSRPCLCGSLACLGYLPRENLG